MSKTASLSISNIVWAHRDDVSFRIYYLMTKDSSSMSIWNKINIGQTSSHKGGRHCAYTEKYILKWYSIIKKDGCIYTPIHVVKYEEKYYLGSGGSRMAVAYVLGWKKVPVHVRKIDPEVEKQNRKIEKRIARCRAGHRCRIHMCPNCGTRTKDRKQVWSVYKRHWPPKDFSVKGKRFFGMPKHIIEILNLRKKVVEIVRGYKNFEFEYQIPDLGIRGKRTSVMSDEFINRVKGKRVLDMTLDNGALLSKYATVCKSICGIGPAWSVKVSELINSEMRHLDNVKFCTKIPNDDYDVVIVSKNQKFDGRCREVICVND